MWHVWAFDMVWGFAVNSDQVTVNENNMGELEDLRIPKLLQHELRLLCADYNLDSWRLSSGNQTILSLRFSDSSVVSDIDDCQSYKVYRRKSPSDINRDNSRKHLHVKGMVKNGYIPQGNTFDSPSVVPMELYDSGIAVETPNSVTHTATKSVTNAHADDDANVILDTRAQVDNQQSPLQS